MREREREGQAILKGRVSELIDVGLRKNVLRRRRDGDGGENGQEKEEEEQEEEEAGRQQKDKAAEATEAGLGRVTATGRGESGEGARKFERRWGECAARAC